MKHAAVLTIVVIALCGCAPTPQLTSCIVFGPTAGYGKFRIEEVDRVVREAILTCGRDGYFDNNQSHLSTSIRSTFNTNPNQRR